MHTRPLPLTPRFALGLACVLTAVGAAPLAAQVETRFDVRVPMRDGVELSADLYLPAAPGPHPVLLMRTPYMKNMELLNPAALGTYFAGHGYAVMVQDARGRGDSDGAFDFFFPDAEDGYDSIDWIARQTWSNGRVCMLGVSYLGTVQWLAAKERPAALRCLVSTAPAGRYGFEELPYRGGAFMHQWALQWLNGTSGRIQQTAGGVDWDRVLAHRPLLTADSVLGRTMRLYREWLNETTSGPYWDRITLGESDFRRIDLPVLHVTGLFDGDQPGALHYWNGMRAHSPARDRQYLLIGPWNHVQTFVGGAKEIGELELSAASILDHRELHRDFFDRYLKGEAGAFEFPRARIYLTGANEWRDLEDYPPPTMDVRPLYLHSGGRANSRFGDGILRWDAPGEQPPDRYTYDPKRPVPAGVGSADDRSAIQRRDDVLVYTSDPLAEPLEIAGPVFVELHAASDARDTDFVVHLLDVFPDGRAVRLGPVPAGILRARYRHGYDRERLLEPGSVERYRIEIGDVAHAFRPRHRVRLEVTSSAAPAYNPNQNTGNPVATDVEWREANQTVYHDRARPSAVLLPVLAAPARVVP